MSENKKEILVADDEPGFRALFRYIFEPRGFQIHTVENGEEALKIAQQKDFFIIFLDVHMPKMTGLEVLKHLGGIKPHQPVVILSSSGEPDLVKMESKILKATGFVQKPFETKELFDIVDKIVEQGSDNNQPEDLSHAA